MITLNKLLSFFLPIKLDSKVGQDGIPLNVYLDRGKIKVYTDNTNYSGGKLKTLFQKCLTNIEIADNCNVLILGFGLGSIWEIIREDKKSHAQIVGVDNNDKIFELIEAFCPQIVSDHKTELIQDDCLDYLKRSNSVFDLVVVDIFNDQYIPNVIMSLQFWKSIERVLNSDALIIFNTMNLTELELESFIGDLSIIEIRKIHKSNSVYFLKLKI